MSERIRSSRLDEESRRARQDENNLLHAAETKRQGAARDSVAPAQEQIGTGASRDQLLPTIYADDWDDLCEVASDMASALRPFVAMRNRSCTCPEDGHSSCLWCEAAHALKGFEDADR